MTGRGWGQLVHCGFLHELKAVVDIRPQPILNSYLAKFVFSIKTLSAVELFWNFAQGTGI